MSSIEDSSLPLLLFRLFQERIAGEILIGDPVIGHIFDACFGTLYFEPQRSLFSGFSFDGIPWGTGMSRNPFSSDGLMAAISSGPYSNA